MEKVAFVGLGTMGYPMAGHLVRAKHDVVVYNRTSEKAVAWQAEYQGSFAATPAEAVQAADIVCMCVGNDDDVRSVVYGEIGILAGLKQGSLLVDHTTASPALAKELALATSQCQGEFLDAPVSGGEAGAVNAALTIMVGGDETAFTRSEQVLSVYAKSLRLMGPSGSGQLTKQSIRSVSPEYCRGCLKAYTSQRKPASMWRQSLMLFQKEQPSPGRWKTAPKRWPLGNSTMGLQ